MTTINKWHFKWGDEIVGAQDRRQLPRRVTIEFDVYGIDYRPSRELESKIRQLVEEQVFAINRMKGNR